MIPNTDIDALVLEHLRGLDAETRAWSDGPEPIVVVTAQAARLRSAMNGSAHMVIAFASVAEAIAWTRTQCIPEVAILDSALPGDAEAEWVLNVPDVPAVPVDVVDATKPRAVFADALAALQLRGMQVSDEITAALSVAAGVPA